ncbi:hypothetical protein [uncultured Psychroserpens sp.]|uniref:hypothetical protein n=1 Tax=uncultured Psychroserpens sp. TaxID=255436 RepID=UPI0026031948|nr:hypothetical protein [uncultured Psychroserpens sp.]
MKKILTILTCAAIFSFVSCEDEPLEGDFVQGGLTCETATANTAQAALNFLGVNVDNYTQLCIAYRNALEAQIQACGDDDGTLQALVDTLGDCTNDVEPTEVEGTWLLTAWIGEEPIDLNNDDTESANFLDEMDCYNNETIVFNNDGSGTVMSTSYAEFTFEIVVGTTDEYNYTIECIDEIENTDVTWTQSGNTVSITDDFGTTDWTLNGNELSITIPDGFSSSNEDGSIIITQDLTFVYTKQ